MKGRVLVIDDEKNIRRTLGMVLRSAEFEVEEADCGEKGLKKFVAEGADVVLLDVNLPDRNGLEILRDMRAADPEAIVLMISGQGTLEIAVGATQAGAFDFLEKPLTKERVLVAVRNALEMRALGRENRVLKNTTADRVRMVGDSGPMRTLQQEIEQVGPSSARVLILGESGTGKELIARAVHDASERADETFVKVNCAAIPDELIESELFGAEKGAYTGAESRRDGKFQHADRGTLFLDEIGDMSLKAQAKVLRALQEGEIERIGGGKAQRVNVRVIAATHRDLEKEVAAGRFREDLYFRLNVVPLHAIPLRERREDIPLLAQHFLERFGVENNRPPLTFSEEAGKALAGLPWPGNVRELENAVERLAIMARGSEIGLGDLARSGLVPTAPTEEVRGAGSGYPADPSGVVALGGLVEARRGYEAECIRQALREAAGNVSAAARRLAIDRTNLHKKIQAYSIDLKESGSEEGAA